MAKATLPKSVGKVINAISMLENRLNIINSPIYITLKIFLIKNIPNNIDDARII